MTKSIRVVVDFGNQAAQCWQVWPDDGGDFELVPIKTNGDINTVYQENRALEAEIERLRTRLRISIGLLKRFTTADQSNMPHFLASDVELFLRGIGGEDE